jgi:hypothetical protein
MPDEPLTPTTTTDADAPKLIRPLDYVPKSGGAWRDMNQHARRWARDTFTRDNIISNLKTLAWVVPLTFLIWVYAEREQIATYKDEALPFELVSVDPNRVVTLNSRQDKNLMVDLQGPQARVQDVLQKLRGGAGTAPQGIRLEVDRALTPNKEHDINAAQLLRSQKIFSDYGITVLSCQPARLLVMVDQVVERDARVVPPPSVENLDASSTFDPPYVKVRGPKSKLDEAAAAQEGNRLVVYAEIPEEVLRDPRHHDLPEISLQRPPALSDDRITITGGAKVKASLDVRAADVADVIASMPILPEIPAAVAEKMQSGQLKIDFNVFKPFLTNVHVVGPKQVIAAMKLPDFAPRPKATIEDSTSDVGDIKQKTLRFDLPSGVSVSDEDKKRTVEFRLIDRGTGE